MPAGRRQGGVTATGQDHIDGPGPSDVEHDHQLVTGITYMYVYIT